MASDVGKVLLEHAEREIAKQNSNAISGPAAAPPRDTAPWTGAPRAETAGNSEPDLQYVDDWNDTNFNQHNSTSMADVTNSYMSEAHGTNGTGYSND